MTVRIRAAGPDDLGTVVAMRLALLRENASHPIYGRLHPEADTRAHDLFAQQLRSAGEVMFLAEDAGAVVGILRCVESYGSPLLLPPRYGYVSSVYVVPSHRRRGVLRALLGAAEEWCRGRALPEMRLHNVADDPVANAAWTAMGFTVVEMVRAKPVPRAAEQGGPRRRGSAGGGR
ncbi:MAG TPA: GNAT family N-acetyltransferase [Gemmatimonadaceae bacterium]